MNITIKNIKHYESMSEETDCFEATLYVDNKKVGSVANRGTGGCNEWRLDDYSLERTLNDWCITNLPKWKMSDTFVDGENKEMDTDLDMHISNLLVNYLETKDLKKLLSKCVAVMTDECGKGEIYEWKFSGYKGMSKQNVINGVSDVMQKDAKDKWNKLNAVVLNSMPFDEAFKVYYRKEVA